MTGASSRTNAITTRAISGRRSYLWLGEKQMDGNGEILIWFMVWVIIFIVAFL